MKNRLLWIVSCLAMLLALAACKDKEPVEKETIRPIKSMRIAGEEPFGGRWFPGKATATQEANLSFRIPGTVDRLPVDVGTNVRKGTLLARLDPQDYEVELNNANSQLSKAKAGLALAESEYARVARVFEVDPGAVSKSMVDVRKAELDTAKAQVVSAEAAVERAIDNLNYTQIKSPYDGVVVQKFVEQFEDVQAKQEIIRVLDTSRIEFTIQVPETLMEHVDEIRNIGAHVVFDTYPDVEVAAKVKEVGKEASRTTRTYPVTLIMEQPKGFRILPGMAGKAKGDKVAYTKIAEASGQMGLEIPVTATFSDDGEKTFVWVVDEASMQVHKREVEVVNLTQNGMLVSGLEVGEVIATAGANILVEGQQVRLLE